MNNTTKNKMWNPEKEKIIKEIAERNDLSIEFTEQIFNDIFDEINRCVRTGNDYIYGHKLDYIEIVKKRKKLGYKY